MVQGHARVIDFGHVYDTATVTGDAVILGSVHGLSVVAGNTVVTKSLYVGDGVAVINDVIAPIRQSVP